MNLSYLPVLNTTAEVQYIVNHNVLDPFSAFFYSICILITALFIHELGHYLVLKHYKKDACIEFFINGKPQLRTGPINNLSNSAKKEVIFAGIGAGMLFIMFSTQVHQFYTLLIAPYIMGCMNDFQKLWKLRGKK